MTLVNNHHRLLKPVQFSLLALLQLRSAWDCMLTIIMHQLTNKRHTHICCTSWGYINHLLDHLHKTQSGFWPTFVVTLLLLCLYCAKFINKRTVYGRPGNNAMLHPHNNLMLQCYMTHTCTQCFGFAQWEHFRTTILFVRAFIQSTKHF